MAVAPDGSPYFRGRVPDVALASAAPAGGTGAGSATQGAAVTAGRGPSRVTFDVKPGKVQLRLSVEGTASQVLDTEMREINVPDLTTPQTSLGTAELFRGLIREKDKGFVIEFREQPRLIQNLTGDSAELQRAAREPSARGATALYDSVVLGLYQFRALQGRKALVVVTDGADNRSHVDYETLLRYARTAGAPIYFIAVNLSIVDFGIRGQLNEIARESGGEVFHTSSPDKVREIVKRIEEELRSQYIVAFRTDSQKPDGEYRAVTVAVGKPGVTARTIKGYIP